MSLIPSIYDKFFLYYFEYGLKKVAKEESNGSAIKNVPPVDVMKNWSFPITSIQEQKRIVENIEEMYCWIDKISIFQSKYLYDLEVLKLKIIDAGIQGKLTVQLSEDGTAEDLYMGIQEEKDRLIKEKKIKKEKVLADISEDEIPFEIPDNWKWVRLNDTGLWSAGATSPRRNKTYYRGNIPWVKTCELNNSVVKQTEECISEKALQDCSLRLNPIGTVLIAMYGATIGKVSILDIEATTNQACCSCITYNGIYNKYLLYYLISHKGDFISRSHGGAQPNISKDIIINELFPLPPYAEQVRIVEKLESILQVI